MAWPTKQNVELARQFKRALALDLVNEGAPAAYELLKLTVKRGLSGLKNDPSYIPNKQVVDSAKALLVMSGMSERVIPQEQSVPLATLSLREIEAMIADLKVIDVTPNADNAAAINTQDLDMFK